MNWIQAIILPVAGALIGWITNWLAVKLIFRPYQPIKFPLLNYSIQGVVPKRRLELARNIGEVIEKELLSVQDLLTYFQEGEITGELMRSVELGIRVRLMDRLPAFIPLSIKNIISDVLAEQVNKELPGLINEVLDRFGDRLEDKLKIGEMVENKLNAYPIERIESIILAVSARELRHIEILGGVLGFFIGLLQVALLYLVG